MDFGGILWYFGMLEHPGRESSVIDSSESSGILKNPQESFKNALKILKNPQESARIAQNRPELSRILQKYF